jgi:hypothetical protein
MKLVKLSNDTGNYPDLSAIPFEVTCPSGLIHGYFEAMHWIMEANVQDGQEEPYESTSDSLILNAIALCERFYRANQAEIDEGGGEGDFELSQLGHDLYLTTQGHGAGFWEKDYPRSMIFDEWVEENAASRDTEYASGGVLYSVSGDINKDIALLKTEHPSAFEFITVEATSP